MESSTVWSFSPNGLREKLERVGGYAEIIATELEQIRMEVNWVLDNRQDLIPLLAEPQEASEAIKTVPESISCTECDIDFPNSLVLALLQGWIDLRYDPTGSHWNFLGTCPSCAKNEPAEAVVKEWAKGPKTEGTLF